MNSYRGPVYLSYIGLDRTQAVQLVAQIWIGSVREEFETYVIATRIDIKEYNFSPTSNILISRDKINIIFNFFVYIFLTFGLSPFPFREKKNKGEKKKG